ncbi:MAG: hypothetical protein ACREP9_00500 [Candidatus Dormibacteraceae bacterium]
MFDPAVVQPAVSFLAGLVTTKGGSALELGIVIEVNIPDLQRVPPGETIRPFATTADRLSFDEYYIANQRVISHHYRVRDGQLDTISIPFRYVWPAELDLMARLAGMALRQRSSGWGHEPFTNDSMRHISVWEKLREL